MIFSGLLRRHNAEEALYKFLRIKTKKGELFLRAVERSIVVSDQPTATLQNMVSSSAGEHEVIACNTVDTLWFTAEGCLWGVYQ